MNKYENSIYRVPLRNREKHVIDYALVDPEDFENVMKYRWCLNHGYASGYVEGKRMFLHHFVFIKPVLGKIIDHINNDRLDNRKCNLRESTRAENSHNVCKRDSSSKYKGVSWDKNSHKYRAQYGSKHLGLFDDEEMAAKTFDIYTSLLHQDKANHNNLINDNDLLNKTLEDFNKVKDNCIPKHIYKQHNQYYALRKYKKKVYKKIFRKTLDEAIDDLIEINSSINYEKVIDEFKYLQTPIKRNKDGIAILICKGDIHALVDDQDWHKLSQMSWYIDNGYVESSIVGRLHRYILKPKLGEIIDHINNNRLDNRRNNLRIASCSLNSHNRKKSENASSKYFGVWFNKQLKKFGTSITYNFNKHNLGYFDNEIDAAKAYNIKAKELYGNNANLNDIPADFVLDSSDK
jgi:hypothetical protein